MLTLLGSAARAEHAVEPAISFSGFGTVGAAHSSERQADFTSNPLRPNGTGHSRRWSSDVDSRFGAQLTGHLGPRWSAVLQVVAEQGADNAWRPRVEWANVQFQPVPEFGIRVGRTVLPAFRVSDYRKVGYANPFVRPPVEVYNLQPISNSDGIDVSYRWSGAGWAQELHALYGQSEPQLPRGGSARARDGFGVFYSIEKGSLTLHTGYIHGRVTLDYLAPLFDGLRQFGPAGVALADRYGAADKPLEFVSVGGQVDSGSWFVSGEWGAIDNHSAFGRKSAWYVAAGRRFGDLTPYLIHARAKVHTATADPGLDLSRLPPSLAGPAAALNAGLNELLRRAPVQQTWSVGARWDVARNTAVKLQFDRTRLGAGSTGTLVDVQPGFQSGGRFQVLSLTLDFVF